MSRKKDQNGISYPRMTLIGILDFEKGTKLEYSDPNWNSWGWKALIGISPIINICHYIIFVMAAEFTV